MKGGIHVRKVQRQGGQLVINIPVWIREGLEIGEKDHVVFTLEEGGVATMSKLSGERMDELRGQRGLEYGGRDEDKSKDGGAGGDGLSAGGGGGDSAGGGNRSAEAGDGGQPGVHGESTGGGGSSAEAGSREDAGDEGGGDEAGAGSDSSGGHDTAEGRGLIDADAGPIDGNQVED
jgi:bifunctional DNA-binding transcriptional regulator/antitoxin component of YhaV-PrlF toxin-antitoxin module